jgi:hypothetical protein
MATKIGVPAAPATSKASATLSKEEDSALQPPFDHARSGHGRAAQAEASESAMHRNRRTRSAAGAVSGGRRRWADRIGGFRFRGLHEPAAAGSFRNRRRGPPKIEAAADRLRNLNPEIQIDTFETRLTSENALDLFKDYDIIVDGTDNFPTRYLVNDACVLLGKPNVYGSIFRFEGQITVFGYPGGPCYRCLYPEPPPPGLVPSCAEGGVLGVLPGIVGTIQAAETLKLIIGKGEPLDRAAAAV